MMKEGILYWITGLSGAGKSTIGRALYYELKKENDNVVIFDGDVLKSIVEDNPEYSKEARHVRAMKYAKLCKALTDQGITVICCAIAMFDDVREWNRLNNRAYVEVFLNTPMEILMRRDQKGMYSKYRDGKFSNLAGMDIDIEFPKNPDMEFANDGTTEIKEIVNGIIRYVPTTAEDYRRDTNYWNNYYGHKIEAIEKPSLFANHVGERLQPGKNLLELGCGNGRDSRYFASLGLQVTAVDASETAIANLQNEGIGGVQFICDDFVSASAIYTSQYDYIYSRFSLHAISLYQEGILLRNVRLALKRDGLFFIEVRSVNDPLYGKGEQIEKDAFLYDGHFRRFMRKDELEQRIIGAKMDIVSSVEDVGFAPFGDEDPSVIRITCRRGDGE